jgi:hypothetical protein
MSSLESFTCFEQYGLWGCVTRHLAPQLRDISPLNGKRLRCFFFAHNLRLHRFGHTVTRLQCGEPLQHETFCPVALLTIVPSPPVVSRYPADGSAPPQVNVLHEPAARTSERIAQVLQQMRRAFPEKTEEELLEMMDGL